MCYTSESYHSIKATATYLDMAQRASNYVFAWQEKSSIMMMLANERACKNGISEIFHVRFSDYLTFFQENQAHFYFSKSDVKRWEAEGEKFLKRGYLERFQEKTRELRNTFSTCIKAIARTDLRSVSNTALMELFQEYYDIVTAISGIYLGTAPEATHRADCELKDLLKKKCRGMNPERVYTTICTPTQLDLVQKEKIDWLALRSKKMSDALLLCHARRYAAYFFNTYSYASAISFLKRRWKDEKISSLTKEIQEMKREKKHVLRERQRILCALPPRADHLSTVLGTLIIERFKLKEGWQGAEFLALPLFQEIARRIGISAEELFSAYTDSDIVRYLSKAHRLPASEIVNRKKAILYSAKGTRSALMTGAKAEGAIKKIFGDKNPKQLILRGMPATSGKISGRVYVMLVEDIDSFVDAARHIKQGDILVTTMTSPNMMLLVKKVAGIVTNEGGTCSHAAVISREMGLPCIVGTKTATQVFKTGDYISIDGERGEVAMVSKAANA